MISIDRAALTTPSILSANGRGTEATRLLVEAISAGQSDVVFDTKLYGHPSVKSLLLSVHHRKCCFCEKSLSDEQADIEHFRPKAGYVEKEGQPITTPGYYWLAYSFDNLLLSCTFCNRSHKKTIFH